MSFIAQVVHKKETIGESDDAKSNVIEHRQASALVLKLCPFRKGMKVLLQRNYYITSHKACVVHELIEIILNLHSHITCAEWWHKIIYLISRVTPDINRTWSSNVCT